MTQEEELFLDRLKFPGVEIRIFNKRTVIRVVYETSGYYFTGSLTNVIGLDNLHLIIKDVFKRDTVGNSPYMNISEILLISKSFADYDKFKTNGFNKDSIAKDVSYDALMSIKDRCDLSVGLEELSKNDPLLFVKRLVIGLMGGEISFNGFDISNHRISKSGSVYLSFSQNGFQGLCGGATVSTVPSYHVKLKEVLGEDVSKYIVYALIDSIFQAFGGGVLLFSDVKEGSGQTISRVLSTWPDFKEVIKDIGIEELNPKTANTMRIYVLTRSDFRSKKFTDKIFKIKEKEKEKEKEVAEV